MKNLAGNKEADQNILQELYLAGINAVNSDQTKNEVSTNYVGKLGDWTFIRAWYYWIATTEDGKGLYEPEAIKLHNTMNPLSNDILGLEIRADGYAGGINPAKVSAPNITPELESQLLKLGYEKKILGGVNFEYLDISYGEIKKLAKEKKITPPDMFVNCYHIDTIVGLKEFANFIKNNN